MEYKTWSKRRKVSFWLSIAFLACFSVAGLALALVNVWLCVAGFMLALFIFIFWVYLILHNYKLEYYFLGKNYNQQRANLKFLQSVNPEYYSQVNLESQKRNYRVTGNILSIIEGEEQNTPFALFAEINEFFPLTAYKPDSLIYALYNDVVSGGMLREFLERLANTPNYDYDKYCAAIEQCECLSQELKRLLLKPEHKEIYELNKNYENLTEKQLDKLEKFELTDSLKVEKFEDELLAVVEQLAMQNYVQTYKFYGVPADTQKIYFNNTGNLRVCVFKDEKCGTFKVKIEQFTFPSNADSNFHLVAHWVEQPTEFGSLNSVEQAEQLIEKQFAGQLKAQELNRQ